MRRLGAAWLLILFCAVPARAIDRITVTYGLREYAEFSDNLFFTSKDEDKIRDVSINTAPDLSIIYDDGETRLLGRGSYRRESFIRNPGASGDTWGATGEFSRLLSPRVSFSLLGSWSRSSSRALGRTQEEPSQRPVFRPERGSTVDSTFWSPSLTIFWSRRFITSLTYGDTQSFGEETTNSIDRSLSLSTGYALSPNTFLNGGISASTNRNSGAPFVSSQDSNTFQALVGVSHVFTPKLSIGFSAGPNWNKRINTPDRVTLLLAGFQTQKDPLFGTRFLIPTTVPDTETDDVSLSVAFDFQLRYQLNRSTSFSLSAGRATTSGEGTVGTQESNVIRLNINRVLNARWVFGLSADASRTSSIPTDFNILPFHSPVTGQQLAIRSISDGLDQEQLTVNPRLSYRINKWLSAFSSWRFSKLSTKGRNAETTRVNTVEVGLEYRRDVHY